MKGFYPIKVLEEKIKEIEQTKDLIIANSFPYLHTEELIKLDLTISKLKKDIELLSKSKTLDIIEVVQLKNQGFSVPELSKMFKCCNTKIRSCIKTYNEIKKKYEKTT